MISTVFWCQKAVSQTAIPAGNNECAARSEKAKELYLKMFNSPSSVDYRKVRNNFWNKLPKDGVSFDDPDALSCEDKILSWAKDNLEKTSFSSYEELKQAWDKKKEAYIQLLKEEENSEFHLYMKELKKYCGPEEFKRLLLDLIKQYGKEFHK
jgi:hypothetical protein